MPLTATHLRPFELQRNEMEHILAHSACFGTFSQLYEAHASQQQRQRRRNSDTHVGQDIVAVVISRSCCWLRQRRRLRQWQRQRWKTLQTATQNTTCSTYSSPTYTATYSPTHRRTHTRTHTAYGYYIVAEPMRWLLDAALPLLASLLFGWAFVAVISAHFGRRAPCRFSNAAADKSNKVAAGKRNTSKANEVDPIFCFLNFLFFFFLLLVW